MAVIESPEGIGLKPFHEFDEANATWPRGDRLDAIPAAADDFRRRFKEQGQVTGVRTVDLVTAGYPHALRLRRGGEEREPVHQHHNRLVIVQFHDFGGSRRTLVWEPTVPEGSAESALLRELIERYGEWLSNSVLAKEYNTVEQALASCGGSGRRRLRFVRPPARAGHAHPDGHDTARGGRARAAQALLPAGEVPLPAQGGRHLPRAAPDAVGLVRAAGWTT